MSHSQESPEATCDFIRQLHPQERHQHLNNLRDSELFLHVWLLLDQSERDEFMWFEKVEELQPNLKSIVPTEVIQRLSENETEGDHSDLQLLLQRWTPEDEFWLFDYIPGDKGYALVRNGQILDFAILEVRCISYG